MADKTITIINRSEIVGRPLAAMLANDGATIYSVDVDSIFTFRRGALRKTEASPEDAVGQSDVVITVSSNTKIISLGFYVSCRVALDPHPAMSAMAESSVLARFVFRRFLAFGVFHFLS